jgi:hypothetical protein
LLTTLVPVDDAHPWAARYFLIIVGFVAYVPIHGAGVSVVHPLLVRRPRILWLIYAVGAAQAALNLLGWYTDYQPGIFAYTRTIGSTAMLIGIAAIIGRCLELAMHTRDPLVAQRARILLAGSVLGTMPIAVVQFLREGFGKLEIDNRFLFWPLGLFVWRARSRTLACGIPLHHGRRAVPQRAVDAHQVVMRVQVLRIDRERSAVRGRRPPVSAPLFLAALRGAPQSPALSAAHALSRPAARVGRRPGRGGQRRRRARRARVGAGASLRRARRRAFPAGRRHRRHRDRPRGRRRAVDPAGRSPTS